LASAKVPSGVIDVDPVPIFGAGFFYDVPFEEEVL
jgi:hypothetical protein